MTQKWTRNNTEPQTYKVLQKEYAGLDSKSYASVIRREGTLWGEYLSQKILRTVYSNMPKQREYMLDVGGGSGVFTGLFIRDFKYVIDVDLSQDMLEVAKSHGHFPLVIADAERLPFKDNSIDLTLGIDVLHHLPDVEQALSEMKRVTKRGGSICIIETNHNWTDLLRRKLTSLARRLAKNGGADFSDELKLFEANYPGLDDFIPINDLREAFNKAGLTDYRMRYTVFIPPAIQNKHLLAILKFLEILLERIPIVKEIGGKVCFLIKKAEGS